MKKKILLLIVGVLIIGGLVTSAYGEESIETTVGSDSGENNQSEGDESPQEPSSSTPNGVTPTIVPAPSWIQEKGKSIIVSYVELSYFNEHISLYSSKTNETTSPYGDKYVLYYKYNVSVKETPNGPIATKELFFHMRFDSNGDLVEFNDIKYWGPKKPYSFNLSISEIEEIAKENGMITPNEPELILGQSQVIEGKIVEESVVWLVEAIKPKAGETRLLLIDVDSGEIIGKIIQGEDEILEPLSNSENQTKRDNIFSQFADPNGMASILAFVVIVLVLIFLINKLRKVKK